MKVQIILPLATINDYSTLALALPGVTEVQHFEKRAFRTKRKVFATLLEENKEGVALLDPNEQFIYCRLDPVNIQPVANKWGLSGATRLQLPGIKKTLLKEILQKAWQRAL